MDPEARIAITATDATAQAFKSADKNLKELERSFRGIRKAADLFGVSLGVNIFKDWIKSGIEAKNLTDAQAESIKEAQVAFKSMGDASDELARSFGTALAPAMDLAAKAMVGLNHAFFGGDPNPLEKQANAIRTSITVMKAQLGASGGMPKTFLDDLKQKIVNAEKALDAMNQKQLHAIDLAAGGPLKEIDLDEIRALKVEAMKSFPTPDISKGQSLSAPLAEFIEEVKTAAKLMEQLETPVEKQIALVQEYRDAVQQGLLDPSALNTLADQLLQPIEVTEKRLKELKPETDKWATEVGRGLQSAFAGWIAGTETDFRDLLRRMAAKLVSSALFSALAQAFGGGGGFWGSFFGGKRAAGGPVSSGKGYLVGEKGPEWFEPGQSGTIVPNGAGGPSINITNHVDARGADPSAASGIQAALAKNNQMLMAQIRDLMRRGRFAT